MLDLVHFACKLNFCLPGSYLSVISVRICRDLPARSGRDRYIVYLESLRSLKAELRNYLQIFKIKLNYISNRKNRKM